MIAEAEHLDMNSDPTLLLFSNKSDRSNPDDSDEMNSNALKKAGDEADVFIWERAKL